MGREEAILPTWAVTTDLYSSCAAHSELIIPYIVAVLKGKASGWGLGWADDIWPLVVLVVVVVGGEGSGVVCSSGLWGVAEVSVGGYCPPGRGYQPHRSIEASEQTTGTGKVI